MFPSGTSAVQQELSRTAVQPPPARICIVEPDSVPGLDIGYLESRLITPKEYVKPQPDAAGDYNSLRKEFGTQTECQLVDVVGRDSSAEVEYHPSRSHNPQSKKVRVVGEAKPPQRSQTELARGRKQPSDGSRGNRPVWNSNVRRQTAPVTQSDRDPAYERRQEQRLERQQKLLAQAAANDRHVPRRFVSRERNQQNTETKDHEPTQTERSRQRRRPSLQTSPARGQEQLPEPKSVERSGRDRPRDTTTRRRSDSGSGSAGDGRVAPRQSSPPIPAMKHRRQDDDRSDVQSRRTSRGPGKYRDVEDAAHADSRDFVPFMRTSDVLDPAHAESPLPVSREPTDMVKARRAYQRELNPAKYGHAMDHRANVQNSNERSSSEQGRILQNLSTLRQMLMEKEREMNSATPTSLLQQQADLHSY